MTNLPLFSVDFFLDDRTSHFWLQVSEPEKWVQDMKDAGCDQLTFHLEVSVCLSNPPFPFETNLATFHTHYFSNFMHCISAFFYNRPKLAVIKTPWRLLPKFVMLVWKLVWQSSLELRLDYPWSVFFLNKLPNLLIFCHKHHEALKYVSVVDLILVMTGLSLRLQFCHLPFLVSSNFVVTSNLEWFFWIFLQWSLASVDKVSW